MEQKPSVGRIVHVIPPGKSDVHAAVVTKVWGDPGAGYVNVVYFDCQDSNAAKPLTSCQFAAELKEPGHAWTWPPKSV